MTNVPTPHVGGCQVVLREGQPHHLVGPDGQPQVLPEGFVKQFQIGRAVAANRIDTLVNDPPSNVRLTDRIREMVEWARARRGEGPYLAGYRFRAECSLREIEAGEWGDL